MFIERLTKEDLIEFFKLKSLSMFINNSLYEKEEYLYVSLDFENLSRNERMYDFDSTDNSVKWRKFLYEKFGEEYKIAYSEFLDNYKEKMLNALQ